MSFAVAFDLALRSADRSLIDLAAQTRLPASTLSRLRTGRRLPTEAHLAALAEALRLSADEAARWRDLALVDRAPAPVRERLRQAPAVRGEGFHDGWWIGYCRTFRDDGVSGSDALRKPSAPWTARPEPPGKGLRRFSGRVRTGNGWRRSQASHSWLRADCVLVAP